MSYFHLFILKRKKKIMFFLCKLSNLWGRGRGKKTKPMQFSMFITPQQQIIDGGVESVWGFSLKPRIILKHLEYITKPE